MSKPNDRLIHFALQTGNSAHRRPLLRLLLCLPLLAIAQNASIVGTVTDPSGAAVPNVNITITNTETGLTQTVLTNDSGQYVVPDLKIGHYDVKAEAAGFKIAEQKNVVLQVGDRDRIDFQMQVGGAQETVTVEANAVRVQTDSGEQSNVITGQQISQIAVSGRSMYQLAALTARSVEPDWRRWHERRCRQHSRRRRRQRGIQRHAPEPQHLLAGWRRR